jgi:hypothetical protein
MSKNFVLALLGLVAVAMLACSPTVVIQEVLGRNSEAPITSAPTLVAQNAAPVMTATLAPQSTAVPSSTAASQATATPAAPATAAPPPSPTNFVPPVLALRDDLPALALRDFPRPANDNGRCIHFLPVSYYTPRDFEIQIPRMKDLQMRWVLALYTDENQLRLAATQFKAAGITPIWRRNMRPYQTYLSWDRDIQILKEVGLPPYFQIYNEPDVDAEWDGRPVNRDQWLTNFLQSAQIIYNSGGYVGAQVLDEAWLTALLQALKARKADRLFGRMFFVPHPYGLNHPPNYVEDDNGVLGFRIFADVFQKEIGFVPPFIAGEGGWKYKAGEDNRFPMIDDKLHAQYHTELFRWFINGKLSDGKPLPDYLFAFCPWILAANMESAAWYDSFEGERTQTIAEVKKILPANAVRKFSWDKK